LQFKASAVSTAALTLCSLSIGKVPGMAQSNNETFVLMGSANFDPAPENSFDFV